MKHPHLHLKCLIQAIIDKEWARVSPDAKKWGSSISSGRYYLDASMITKGGKPAFYVMLDNGARILSFKGAYDEMSGKYHNIKTLTPLGAYKFTLKLMEKLYDKATIAEVMKAAQSKYQEIV